MAETPVEGTTAIEGTTAVEEHGKHPNYVAVFILLGILTATEVGASVYLTRSAAKVPILLMLAAAKGLLVALYYMHLRFDSRIFSFFFGAAIFFLAVPFALILLVTSATQTGAEQPPPLAQATPRRAPTAPAPPPVQGSATLLLSAKESGCTPPAVFCWDQSQLTAKAGQNVTVSVKNPAGNSSPHAFSVKTVTGSDIPEFQPGKDASVTFKAPAPGSYTYICPVPGHEQLGMTGTLVVQ